MSRNSQHRNFYKTETSFRYWANQRVHFRILIFIWSPTRLQDELLPKVPKDMVEENKINFLRLCIL